MQSDLVLSQSWPVLLLSGLLAQHGVEVLRVERSLGCLGVNLVKELEREGVRLGRDVLGRVTDGSVESESGGGELELGLGRRGEVWDVDGEHDNVLLGLISRRALAQRISGATVLDDIFTVCTKDVVVVGSQEASKVKNCALAYDPLLSTLRRTHFTLVFVRLCAALSLALFVLSAPN